MNDFNPRTPCGVRLPAGAVITVTDQFQSTHSMRSATEIMDALKELQKYFNPRTPAECDVLNRKTHQYENISIHALHAECDRNYGCTQGVTKIFQSTHSMRSATKFLIVSSDRLWISIHALHAECDLTTWPTSLTPGISIHALHAECDFK